MIQIPTPITASTFNGMWVANLRLTLPDLVFTNPIFPQSKGSFIATLLPYDGQHLLATGAAKVNITDLTAKRASDATFNGVVAAMIAETKRQANKTIEPTAILVSAPDPTKKVVVIAQFSDKTSYTINDAYTLASTDSTFAGVFVTTMNEVARQAGLTVA